MQTNDNKLCSREENLEREFSLTFKVLDSTTGKSHQIIIITEITQNIKCF